MNYQISKIARQIGRLPKNVIYGGKNLILRATSESLRPRQLWFEVTDKCNCRCKFCNIWRNRSTKNVLTPEEIGKALSDDLFKELEYIMLSGGEPFLRADLEEIIMRIHNILPKAQIFVGTNCSLPDRVINVVKSAISNNINIGVGISLDGIGEQHDSVRGMKGLFEKVDWLLHELLVLRKIAGDKLSIATGFVLSDITLPVLEEVKAYTHKMNVQLHVQWYNEALYYDNIGKHLLSNTKAIIDAIHLLSPTPIHEMGIKLLTGKSIKFPCFAMYTFCLLKCSGDIVPCFNLWDVKVGNLRESPPSLIWQSLEAKKARRKVKNCQGCLNACGVVWSFGASFYPLLLFELKKNLRLMK